MVLVLMVVGVVAEASAWLLVAGQGRSVWAVLTPTVAALALAAVLVEPPGLSPDAAPAAAAGVGMGAGVVLYGATRAFVAIARGWAAFRRQSEEIYGREGSLSLAASLVLGAGVTAACEEVFFRGFLQANLSSSLGAAAGALLAWLLYVLANLPSANLAIVAGALVGGAVWTGLWLWTHGVLASLLCHCVWTALMLALPPVPARKEAPNT